MAQGWSPIERAIQATVPASQTDAPISREYAVTAGGARMCAVAITTGTTTGTVTAKLQTAFGTVWVDRKTVALTAGAGGTFYITLLDTLAGDQTYLPLFDKCRVVVTTAAASTVVVSSVLELQER